MIRTRFTLGYEGLSVGAFVARLKTVGVETVFDVRELPLSRKPGFSKRSLAEALRGAGIAYAHLPALGCSKPIRVRYRADGDWSAYVRAFAGYLAGRQEAVAELARAANKTSACLVCFEADFNFCHRSMVARATVRAGGPSVTHLTAKAAIPDASAPLAAVHETARGLHDAGVMGKRIMRQFDDMCLTPGDPAFEAQKTAAGRAVAKRSSSDESYIIDRCDRVLCRKAKRQHRFDFLRGDPSPKNGQGAKLPVDAYYEDIALVIEFMESQHSIPTAHFDKPDKMTVSGVHRGEQRRKYDKRRRKVLPSHGIKLVVLDVSQFSTTGTGRKKLRRDQDYDERVIGKKLARFL